jgi:hypothetical protein
VAVIVIALNPLLIVSSLKHIELYRSLVRSLGGITSSGLILPPGIKAIVPNYRGVPSFLYTSLVQSVIDSYYYSHEVYELVGSVLLNEFVLNFVL